MTDQHPAVVYLLAAHARSGDTCRVAAEREILAEHAGNWATVEWPHDQNGRGEAVVCARCQNAEHTDWRVMYFEDAGVLPDDFVAPYVLWPCRTVLGLAKAWGWEAGRADG